jgi:hypothetical protein
VGIESLKKNPDWKSETIITKELPRFRFGAGF